MATSKVITAERGDKVVKLSDKVDFVVGYVKDYAGTKYLKDGSKHKLHRLHAERLQVKGIGKIAE